MTPADLLTRAPAPARRRGRSVTLAVGVTLAGLIALLALVSLVWLPYATDDTSGGRLAPPGDGHLLGTDKLGRDLFTQLMTGSRIAVEAGLGSVAIAALIGVTLGVLAAFAQGWLDDTLAAFLDILIAFPTLLLAMLVVAARSATLGSAVLAIGLAQSAVVARLVRILVKRVLAEDYVTAARTSGTSWPRTVAGHVLPNIWPTLVVNLALQFGLAVLAEAGLSYLGLGAPPPNASWGRMLQEAQATFTTAPAGALAPGVLLVLLVVGVNLIADGLRDTLDPATRGRRS
ncbi:ABC transporter permease [Streptomyces sp. NPDC005840]|jgi:peptide/nickel transport system permease protein|uniref:ABC transporter permease n=1 Tax=Streptomyces doudnae TaxID=3075536 RepID=A0ABD5F1L5_9ACTN|nr:MULTISPECIES: ABC transporter permease [unclassified Streptomyces]MDT0440509.1 ABC transporter permease [Streptomyces sp. DSM 41981]MYQ64858.1 ABC transporter permease subunit [Streptomyces sp. SID4950]SCD87709.1 peptide/nickel transport system permease protein [Streptomyces sp. SolWspMP-5a-2]